MGRMNARGWEPRSVIPLRVTWLVRLESGGVGVRVFAARVAGG